MKKFLFVLIYSLPELIIGLTLFFLLDFELFASISLAYLIIKSNKNTVSIYDIQEKQNEVPLDILRSTFSLKPKK